MTQNLADKTIEETEKVFEGLSEQLKVLFTKERLLPRSKRRNSSSWEEYEDIKRKINRTCGYNSQNPENCNQKEYDSAISYATKVLGI